MTTSQIHHLFIKSSGICTDTRKLQKNQLFIALKGHNFDGNQYAIQALENGASYAIIDDATINHDKAILVSDTLKALQELATFHRQHLNIPIIALTGSNGKTTTKELIHSVLKTQYNCIATQGNFNNHIGVPLTLLSMSHDTEIGVVEMGANHLKEIADLSEIARPNYGYITNIGKAHLEGFGSEENILIGKTELYDFIKKNNGILFSNSDDEKLNSLAKSANTIFFSKKKANSLSIVLSKSAPFLSVVVNQTEINSKLIGLYNHSNIAAAITIGIHFKISIKNIKTAIENYTPKNNRSELITKKTNHIILDAYNANPSSMKAALENFISMKTNKKQKIAILGDMFELGKHTLSEHQHLINSITNSSIDQIFLTGTHFSSCKINSDKIVLFQDTKSLILHLQKHFITDSLLLIKGSRGMQLEETLVIFE